MAKHGVNKPIWPSIFFIMVVAIAITASIAMIFINPQWKP
jgi:hypothetical protein